MVVNVCNLFGFGTIFVRHTCAVKCNNGTVSEDLKQNGAHKISIMELFTFVLVRIIPKLVTVSLVLRDCWTNSKNRSTLIVEVICYCQGGYTPYAHLSILKMACTHLLKVGGRAYAHLYF